MDTLQYIQTENRRETKLNKTRSSAFMMQLLKGTPMKSIKHLIVFSFTLIIISLILGSSFKEAFEHLNTIKITGSAKRDFLS